MQRPDPLIPPQQLAQKLRHYRKTKRMSQFDLEVKTGIQLGTVSRIENCIVNPTKETIIRLAYGLELSIHEVIDLLCLEDIFEPINEAK